MPSPELETSDPYPDKTGRPPLILIVGPTAVGKTEIAIQLAERLDGEIISADSRLFYCGMDIGTAKPSALDRARVTHHLIDIAIPDQVWSLALFQREAIKAIQSIHQRGKLPFLVGGTGQYIQAIAEQWQLPPAQPEPILRRVLESWAVEITPAGLHKRLVILDPKAAASIDPQNLRRTIRALEVILSTGQLFSSQRKHKPSPYRLLMLGLIRPRSELYFRIDQRIQDMIQAGFVEEVRGLLAQGYTPELPTLSAIGYGEIIRFLQGEISLDEAVTLMKRKTRVFVRRQANWFKEIDPDIHWYRVDTSTSEAMTRHIQAWISSQPG